MKKIKGLLTRIAKAVAYDNTPGYKHDMYVKNNEMYFIHQRCAIKISNVFDIEDGFYRFISEEFDRVGYMVGPYLKINNDTDGVVLFNSINKPVEELFRVTPEKNLLITAFRDSHKPLAGILDKCDIKEVYLDHDPNEQGKQLIVTVQASIPTSTYMLDSTWIFTIKDKYANIFK